MKTFWGNFFINYLSYPITDLAFLRFPIHALGCTALVPPWSFQAVNIPEGRSTPSPASNSFSHLASSLLPLTSRRAALWLRCTLAKLPGSYPAPALPSGFPPSFPNSQVCLFKIMSIEWLQIHMNADCSLYKMWTESLTVLGQIYGNKSTYANVS